MAALVPWEFAWSINVDLGEDENAESSRLSEAPSEADIVLLFVSEVANLPCSF
jgi:hypothetical protein